MNTNIQKISPERFSSKPSIKHLTVKVTVYGVYVHNVEVAVNSIKLVHGTIPLRYPHAFPCSLRLQHFFMRVSIAGEGTQARLRGHPQRLSYPRTGRAEP